MKKDTTTLYPPDISNFTRRDFLRLAWLVGAGLGASILLPACSEGEKDSDNEPLRKKIWEILQLPNPFTRDQLAEQAAQRMCEVGWMANKNLGTYMSSERLYIPLRLNSIGELDNITLNSNNPKAVKIVNQANQLKYPQPNPQETDDRTFNIIINGRKVETHVITYGTHGTISRVSSQIEECFKNPLPLMLDGISSDLFTFHFNFAPQGTIYLDIHDLGYSPQRPLTAHTHIIPYDDAQPNGNNKRIDFYFDLFQHHRQGFLFGFDHHTNLASTFVNEMDGLLGRTHNTFNTSPGEINEAHSTLMGWLAVVEPNIVSTVIGGAAIDPIITAIGDEMDILAKIGAT